MAMHPKATRTGSLWTWVHDLFHDDRPPRRDGVDVTTLEDRTLFSAVPIDIMAMGGDAMMEHDGANASLSCTTEVCVPVSSDVSVAYDTTGDTGSNTAPSIDSVSRELLVIDSRLDDLDRLLAGLENDGSLDILMLDGERDGIAQITATLANHAGRYDAIHIVSHGTTGTVQLGSVTLDADQLTRQSEQLSRWADHLSEDADILFYGCDVASNDEGALLLSTIGELTKSDIAGSTDLTGDADVGGDWVLEFAFGSVEHASLFSHATTDWHSLLDMTAVGGETLVNGSTSSNQYTTPYGGGNVAMNGSGQYVVVWDDYRSGNADTYAKVYNADGSVHTAEFRVHAANTSNQDWSNVSMANNGNFAITWSDNRSGSYETYMRLFDIDGNALIGETVVSTQLGVDDAHAVDSATDGSYVVVWQNASSNSGDIFYQRYNSSGVAQGGNVRVNTTTANIQNHPDVAVNDDGSFVVTWMSTGQDGSGYGMYAQRYNASGVAQGSEFRINQTTANDQWYGTVDSDSSGNFVVTWMSNLQDGCGEGIFSRRYNARVTAL
ncbi:MAG: DUF4347 domain-containing protein, partial [Planctomycetales bacterium]|nr:DUF4347 domain-containing protein [Planctomycetales bacterium]